MYMCVLMLISFNRDELWRYVQCVHDNHGCYPSTVRLLHEGYTSEPWQTFIPCWLLQVVTNFNSDEDVTNLARCPMNQTQELFEEAFNKLPNSSIGGINDIVFFQPFLSIVISRFIAKYDSKACHYSAAAYVIKFGLDEVIVFNCSFRCYLTS